MIKLIFFALALICVVEGIMPLASPAWFRRMLIMVSSLDDNSLRMAGAAMVVTGLLIALMV